MQEPLTDKHHCIGSQPYIVAKAALFEPQSGQYSARQLHWHTMLLVVAEIVWAWGMMLPRA
jgi:hypothetical protein